MQGPIKALGLQAKVVPYNLVAYWIINFSFAILFAFVFNWGYAGIWIAMIMAQLFICAAQFYLLMNADWEQAAIESQERRNKEEEKEKERNMCSTVVLDE